jgi:hypothetical protein
MHAEGVSNFQAGLRSSRPKDTEERLQSATAAELGALIVEILDKAFKREL